MKSSSIKPVRLRLNTSFIQPFIFIIIIAVLLSIPFFLSWQPIYDALYDRYVKEKCTNLDTKLEYEIKLLGVVVIGIGVIGFLIHSWYQRLENRKFAFQQVIENEIKLIEFPKNDPELLKFFDSLDVRKSRNTLPQHYVWYIAMAFTIWQQVFAYRMNGWINRKTWQYWAPPSQRGADIGQQMCSTDPFTGTNPTDEIIRQNTYKYFLLWWQEKQNYRYYHVDFVRYINSILTDVENKEETEPFYS